MNRRAGVIQSLNFATGCADVSIANVVEGQSVRASAIDFVASLTDAPGDADKVASSTLAQSGAEHAEQGDADSKT